MNAKLLFAAAMFALASAAPVHANLIGDTIFADFTSATGHSISPGSAVVVNNGAIVLFTVDDGTDDDFDVRVENGNRFIFQSVSSATLFGAGNLLEFTDLDWVGQSGSIVGVSLVNEVDMFSLDASNLSFTANSLTIDFGGVSFATGGTSGFDVLLDVQHNAAPVPSSFALLGIAVLGMASSARKRRRS